MKNKWTQSDFNEVWKKKKSVCTISSLNVMVLRSSAATIRYFAIKNVQSFPWSRFVRGFVGVWWWRGSSNYLVRKGIQFQLSFNTVVWHSRWSILSWKRVEKSGCKNKLSMNWIQIQTKEYNKEINWTETRLKDLSFHSSVFCFCSVPVEPSHPSSECAEQPGAASPE